MSAKQLWQLVAWRWLWSTFTVSAAGDAVFNIAIIWYIFSTSHSVVASGWVLIVAWGIPLALAPVSGPFVDRHNQKRILLWIDGIQAAVFLVTFFGMTLPVHLSYQALYVVVGLEAALSSI